MKNSWSLREELAEVSQHWYTIFLFILVGALVGAGIALILPSPYEASSDFYVGLDVYRYLRDLNIPIRPEGVNDYKNWQMEDLKMVILSGKTLEETLKLLQQEDPGWNDKTTSELSDMLSVYWRNAGRWRLGVENPDKKSALQAVQAWERAALKEVKYGVEQSQLVMVLDARIQALAAEQAELEARKAQVGFAQAALNSWLLKAGALPESELIQEDLLQELLNPLLAAQINDPGKSISEVPEVPFRIFLWNNPPSEQYTLETVKAWAYLASARLQSEAESLADQSSQLNDEMTRLKEHYASASKNSWGLSANLIVRSLTDEPPSVRQLRPISQMILIGAIAGLLLWLFQWMVGISRNKQSGTGVPSESTGSTLPHPPP